MENQKEYGSEFQQIEKPTTKYIKPNLNTGRFEYWDKEKKESIPMPTPFTFCYLKELFCITGFNQTRAKLGQKGGIYSNEVFSFLDTLTVRYQDKTLIAKGTWKDVKSIISDKKVGGKFARSNYILIPNKEAKDGVEIANLQLSGWSLQSYSDFIKANLFAPKTHWITVKSTKVENLNNTKYFIPVFTKDREITPAGEAIRKDFYTKFLLPYFNSAYFDNTKNSQNSDNSIGNTPENTHYPRSIPAPTDFDAPPSEWDMDIDLAGGEEDLPF